MSEAAAETSVATTEPEHSIAGGAAAPTPPTPAEEAKKSLEDIYPSMREDAAEETGDEKTEKAAESPDPEKAESEELDAKATEEKDSEAAKPDDAKDEKAKDTKSAAAEYDLEVPEGFELDEDRKSEFLSLASKYEMDQEGAQGLLNLHLQMLAENEKLAEQNFKNTRAAWRKACREHETIGGENYEQSVQDVGAALDLCGTPELREFLDHGAGDHPAVVEFLAKIGQQIRQGGFKISSAGGGAGGGAPSFSEMYPNSPDLK